MSRKLYEVTVSKTIYVLTDDKSEIFYEAERWARDDMSEWDVFPRVITEIPRYVAGSLVFGPDEDTTIEAALIESNGGDNG